MTHSNNTLHSPKDSAGQSFFIADNGMRLFNAAMFNHICPNSNMKRVLQLCTKFFYHL